LIKNGEEANRILTDCESKIEEKFRDCQGLIEEIKRLNVETRQMIEMEFINTRKLNEEGLMTMKNDFNNWSMEMDKMMAGNNSMLSYL
jgi:uncharacterized lipoprotein YehR (DUF1307 family)